LLDAIKNGASLNLKKPGNDDRGADGDGGGNPYGDIVGGKWVMRKPPPGMDMFGEMAWKKKAKVAKDDWVAANTGGGGGDAPAAPASAPAPPRHAAAAPPAPAATAPAPPAPKPTAAAATAQPAAATTPRPVAHSSSSSVHVVAGNGGSSLDAGGGGAATSAAALEQMKQELIAAFKAEIQTAKADILAEVKHMLTVDKR